MKKIPFLVAALAGVCLAGSAFAYSGNDAAGKNVGSAAKLIPSKIVNPTGLPAAFVGVVVNIEFAVDQKGQPRDIRVLAVSDPVLKRQLVQAFSQWRFDGEVREASATNKHFILPLEIVPEA